MWGGLFACGFFWVFFCVFFKENKPGGHQVESAVCPCNNKGQRLSCISKSIGSKLMEAIILAYHLGARSWKTAQFWTHEDKMNINKLEGIYQMAAEMTGSWR